MAFGNYLQLIAGTCFWIASILLQIRAAHETQLETGVQSNLLDRLLQYQYALQHFFTVFVVVFSFSKRKNVEHFLKLIYKFDQLVEGLRWTHQVEHSRCVVLMFYGFSVLLILFYTILSTLIELRGGLDINLRLMMIQTIPYIAITEFYFMTSLKFIFSCHCIKSRFVSLMKNIR